MQRDHLSDEWVAMLNGQPNALQINGWNPMKMICLGDPDAEKFTQEHLLGIIEDFNLDWLEWDASGEPGLDIVCNRADHMDIKPETEARRQWRGNIESSMPSIKSIRTLYSKSAPTAAAWITAWREPRA
jgi:hypothetical protein